MDRPWKWKNPGWYEEREAQRIGGQRKGLDSELIVGVGQKTKVNRSGGSGV